MLLNEDQISEICANGGIVIERYLFIKDGYLNAKLACWLPCEQGSTDLNSILVRTNREIFGVKFYFTLGVFDCNARLITTQKAFPLTVDSIEPASQWIEQQTQSAVNAIKQVISEFQQVNSQLTDFEPVVFNISEVA